MRRFLAAMLPLLLTLPAGALPPGLGDAGPTAWLLIEPTADPFEFDLTLHASDPDGRIRFLSLCLADVCAEHATVPAGIAGEAAACIDGDSASLSVRVRAPGYGVFPVVGTVTAGGCPLVGSDITETANGRVGVPPPLAPIPCAGGSEQVASDVGITPDTVELGAVIPASGFFSIATRDAIAGIRAAAARINAAGGICDRTLNVTTIDDGGDTQLGRTFVQDLAQQTFALVGMSWWPTLAAAIEGGDIAAAGIPVIGTSGESASEFAENLVFPLGPGRGAFARIAASHAYQAGGRSFALVWNDPFGTGVPEALAAALASMPGASLTAERRVSISEPSYQAVINDIRTQCETRTGGMCDAVVLALDSSSGVRFFQAWHQADAPATQLIAGPHMLRSRFPADSGECHGMVSWAPLEAPVPPAGPPVAEYEAALLGSSPTADPLNPLAEMAYAATMLAAHAIGRAGTNPMRAHVQAILSSETFDLGLTHQPLSWAQTRHANRSMRGYRALVPPAGDPAWEHATGWLSDG